MRHLQDAPTLIISTQRIVVNLPVSWKQSIFTSWVSPIQGDGNLMVSWLGNYRIIGENKKDTSAPEALPGTLGSG